MTREPRAPTGARAGSIEVRVESGAHAGSRQRFVAPVVTVGRHPTSDLRFDLHGDLDVSARHAELRFTDDAWWVRDLGSTNGTFVNGERVTADRRLAAGDTIAFGANGPRVEVRGTTRVDTEVRVAAEVRRQTAGLRRGVVFGVVLLIAVGVAGALMRQRGTRADGAPAAAPVPGAAGAAVGSAPAPTDFSAIRDRNDPAVAMIASDLDGEVLAGTAFGVTPDGMLVTNRHIVRSVSGVTARRLRVIFANTTDWIPAHVERADEGDDLALVRLDRPGRYPVVSGRSPGAVPVRVGAPVATIGYPHAVDTPMEGSGLHVTARSTMTAGTVSKRLDDLLQIDSYAGRGSSGSPVFDVHGDLVGVVFGGAAEAGGRIVYAVPAARLAAFLRRAGVQP